MLVESSNLKDQAQVENISFLNNRKLNLRKSRMKLTSYLSTENQLGLEEIKKYQDQISPSKLKHHSIFISISENGTNLIVNNGKSHFQEKITGSELNSK